MGSNTALDSKMVKLFDNDTTDTIGVAWRYA